MSMIANWQLVISVSVAVWSMYLGTAPLNRFAKALGCSAECHAHRCMSVRSCNSWRNISVGLSCAMTAMIPSFNFSRVASSSVPRSMIFPYFSAFERILCAMSSDATEMRFPALSRIPFARPVGCREQVRNLSPQRRMHSRGTCSLKFDSLQS